MVVLLLVESTGEPHAAHVHGAALRCRAQRRAGEFCVSVAVFNGDGGLVLPKAVMVDGSATS
jgi:hypothetical protein